MIRERRKRRRNGTVKPVTSSTGCSVPVCYLPVIVGDSTLNTYLFASTPRTEAMISNPPDRQMPSFTFG